jgi:cytochrome c oxidase subunit 1
MMRWITTTTHKDIGTLYLWFSFAMFLTGGASGPTCRPRHPITVLRRSR